MLKLAVLLTLCYGITKVHSDYQDTLNKFPPAIREMMANLRKHCLAETGINEKILDDAHQGKFDAPTELATYVKCTWRTSGFMEDDGYVFLIDDFLNALPDDVAKYYSKLVDQCGIVRATSEDDLTEKIIDYLKCYYNFTPDTFFLA